MMISVFSSTETSPRRPIPNPGSLRDPSSAAPYCTIRAKSSGSSEAPPTSPPSISGIAISSATFPGFTLPP